VRRPILAAAALAAALAAPALAQDTTEDGLRSSIATLDVETSIATIEIEGSVERLETERRRGNTVTVTVSADVLFAFDRATLTPQARTTIERVGGRIGRGPVRVDGHTDSIGTATYNLGLSRRRAAAVSEALQDALDPGTAVRARGFGEARPVAPNTRGGEDDPAGRAQNRRVTISFRRG
jgi:OmpA-OmpF porin, OOP family